MDSASALTPVRFPAALSHDHRKIGRPTIYTEGLADQICDRLIQGESLIEICEDPSMPGYRAVMYWLSGRDDKDGPNGFVQRYSRARELQQHTKIEQGEARAKRTLQRAEEGEATKEEVGALREFLRHLHWQAARLAPRVYGDHLHHVGHDGGAIKHEHEVGDRLEQAILKADAQRKALVQGEDSPEIVDITAAAKVEPEPAD